jgi:hypothetical protein
MSWARARRWYSHVVHRAFRRGTVKWAQRRAEVSAGEDEPLARARAQEAVRSACLRSAGAGAAVGVVATAGSVLTAKTNGWGALAAVPVTAAAIGGEIVLRAGIHVDLACHLAEIFGVPLDAADEDDLWRLYALVFETCDGGVRHDRGRGLLEEVVRVGPDEVGESLGVRLLETALLRDAIPFVAIAASAIGNYRTTRRLGHVMRRYLHYERALRDAVVQARAFVREHRDVLIEGIWYVFVADGTLKPEEAAMLAHLLRPLDPAQRDQVIERFVDDEEGWIQRLHARVPEEARDAFVDALRVAAMLDRRTGLPQRRVLRRVGRALGR